MSILDSILESLVAAGFELQSLERYPQAITVVRGECIALLRSDAASGQLSILGAPGWRLGESIGVLTTRQGKQVFQHKHLLLDATPARLAELQQFKSDLQKALAA